ncbi:hypothetical protein AVEN_103008-1 [Araneus ventricosus]|uniref:Transposase Tc1-like domain-containing protein n=1 Tax=Araneus ventricosus TaxID=182803 RepID=A0A4Y2BB52_ARAVE|nr:hypothetical protein AVEN_103008-1 [Araneus ventricosus]
MDFIYYANEDGTSYLFTRDYYYKKDIPTGLETGCVTRRRPRNVGRKVQPEDVLAYALAHPQSSMKIISENCGLSKSHVWTILNESGAHPYRSTPVQRLLPRDAERRYTWCNFVMNNLEDHPTFLAGIIWTDEACFSRSGNQSIGQYLPVHKDFFSHPPTNRRLEEEVVVDWPKMMKFEAS